KLARLWGPVLAYVGEKNGYILTFKTAKDIPTFEERLLSGQYDLSYMNPYHYTVYHSNPGYLAFAKEKDKRIQGIVVVKEDSSYKDISELSGLTLAFPAPAAFAATVLPRAYFLQNNIHVTPKYVSSHDSVYRSVAQGIYPAGGGIMRTFNNMNDEINNQLRILWKTDYYTPHAIATHPRVPKKVITAIQKTLIEMEKDPKGKILIHNLSIKGFERAVDSDWDDVRALGIDLLDSTSK
ncbi:MAG: phosphate/phosphite/phosphonate ABC transporter substrate-binding protein, partial [Desulfobacteraceae bacterium]